MQHSTNGNGEVDIDEMIVIILIIVIMMREGWRVVPLVTELQFLPIEVNERFPLNLL